MSSEEPPTKKARTAADWEGHKLNCAEALVKDVEGKSFNEIIASPVASLQGIGPVTTKFMEALKITTVKDLASYKYFKFAKAVATLAPTEGARPSDSFMNVDHALDKAAETKSFKEILEAPIADLEGLTGSAEALFKDLKVETVGELATCKFFTWADAMVALAAFEETKTKEERKQEKLAKQLA